MLTPRFNALNFLRYIASLLVLAAVSAAADIDTSILRSKSKGPGAAATDSAGTETAARQPAAPAEKDPDAWYARATALDRPGASGDDLASASYWYQKAAEQGHTDAQVNLAVMYAEGRGVEFNDLEAARWYRRAAEAGNMRAQYALALMYHLGQGVTQDFDDAVRWYESAARQGDANAMNNMAFMYGMGEGVEQSNIEAYAWFALAASRGNADAAENRDLAETEMTPEERRRGRARYTQLEEQLGL